MKTKKIPENGFTLVELLVVLALVSVLIGALGGLLMGSSQVFKLLHARSDARLENTAMALDKLARELQSSFVTPEIPFQGQIDRVSFPRVVELGGESRALEDFKLGQVQTVTLGRSFACRKASYFFDKNKGALMRQAADEEPEEVLGGLKAVKFWYAVKASDDSAWRWDDETPRDKEARIGAVRVRFVFDPAFYRYTIPGLERTFFIVREHPLNVFIPAETSTD